MTHMVQLLFPLRCWLIHLHKMPVLLGLASVYIGCTLQLYWQQNYQLWWLVRQRMELQNYQCCWVLHWCMMGYTQCSWVIRWCMANVLPVLLGLTLTYGQCTTQWCWVVHWEWDYKIARDVGSYIGSEITKLPVTLVLTLTYSQCTTQHHWVVCWGWDYKITSDVGSYIDVQPMYHTVLLGSTLGVRLWNCQ